MDFIYEVKDALPKEICDIIIERYKKESYKEKSRVGKDGVVRENMRKSLVFPFSRSPKWKDVDNIICDVIGLGIKKYTEHVKHILTKNGTTDNNDIKNAISVYLEELTDEGYFVQEYKIDGFYNWHVDSSYKRDNTIRSVSFVLYLNTLEKNEGGYTEFALGKSIRPEAGKLLIFPSGWEFVHRSAIVTKPVSKYTIGTWAV
jgi:NADPH-dependent 7-cyano-7-deazaguanine reductase QueF-like protein